MRKSTFAAIIIFVILFIAAFASSCDKEQIKGKDTFNKLTANPWYYIDSNTIINGFIVEKKVCVIYTKDYKITNKDNIVINTYSLKGDSIFFGNTEDLYSYKISFNEDNMIFSNTLNNSKLYRIIYSKN